MAFGFETRSKPGGNFPCQSSPLSFARHYIGIYRCQTQCKATNGSKHTCALMLKERRITFHEQFHQKSSTFFQNFQYLHFFIVLGARWMIRERAHIHFYTKCTENTDQFSSAKAKRFSSCLWTSAGASHTKNLRDEGSGPHRCPSQMPLFMAQGNVEQRQLLHSAFCCIKGSGVRSQSPREDSLHNLQSHSVPDSLFVYIHYSWQMLKWTFPKSSAVWKWKSNILRLDESLLLICIWILLGV